MKGRTLQSSQDLKQLTASTLLVGPLDLVRQEYLRWAQTLACEKQDAQPCMQCRACRLVEQGSHPDVRKIAPSGKGHYIRLEQILTLQNIVQVHPLELQQRLYCIEHADCLDLEAANAFLKTLEEPPAHTLFVLTSEAAQKVLATLRSRCCVVWAQPDPEQERSDQAFAQVWKKLPLATLQDLRREVLEVLLQCHSVPSAQWVDQAAERIQKALKNQSQIGQKEVMHILLNITQAAVRDLAIMQLPASHNLSFLHDDFKDLLHAHQHNSSWLLQEQVFERSLVLQERLNFNLSLKSWLMDLFVTSMVEEKTSV